MPLNIAIDGPAGAGKTTIASEVANHLSIQYLDTGAMYRALAYKALRDGVDPRAVDAVRDMLENTRVEVVFDDLGQRIRLDGQLVDDKLREAAVSNAASDISVHGCVREYMVDLQREIASGRDIVLDGRDIGTNVLPDAQIKIFLTAAPSVRARRRFDQLTEQGKATMSLTEMEEDIKRRDHQDSNREIAPLKQADDAYLVDTSELSISDVVQIIIKIIGGGT